MSDGAAHVTADALRAEFDQAFAARRAAPPDVVALLAIRVGGAPFAVRLLDAGGLATLRQVVPVPSRRAELLGVSGVRGEALPIYSLARLVLGADDVEAPRWMILAGGREPVGLAFATFEGHVVVGRGELRPVEGAEADRAHVAAIHPGPPVRPVLSIASLVEAVRGG